jgi:hypothetical protein
MPAFLVRFVDENGDGVPDDANGDNVPDLWPRVVVRKLADWGTGLTDENDMDNNGQLDPQGIDYVRSDGTKDGEPDLVVLAAGLTHVDSLIAQLTDDQGRPRMDAVLPMQELNVTVLPRAFDARDPSAPPVPLQSMPPGRYAVIVIQSTGQVWRVPNELAPGLAPTLGLPSVESQGVALQVPASP